MNQTEGYGQQESFDVIAADKVEGTSVYNMSGDKVGSIKNVMIDKTSGRVVYATMSYGGVLGVGAKYHALPWGILNYNADLGGYQIDIDRDKLEHGPVTTEEELASNAQNRDWGRRVYDYYGSSWTA